MGVFMLTYSAAAGFDDIEFVIDKLFIRIGEFRDLLSFEVFYILIARR